MGILMGLTAFWSADTIVSVKNSALFGRSLIRGMSAG